MTSHLDHLIDRQITSINGSKDTVAQTKPNKVIPVPSTSHNICYIVLYQE